MGGRPHWGKNGGYFFTQAVLNLNSAVPNRQAFRASMATYDPNRVFINKFGNRILGISDLLDRDPSATHCALQDYCVCHSSSDCGNSLYCTRLNGYPICKNLLAINSPLLNIGLFTNLTTILQDFGALNIG